MLQMTKQTPTTSQRKQNNQDGCVKHLEVALSNVIVILKKNNDECYEIVACKRHEQDYNGGQEWQLEYDSS